MYCNPQIEPMPVNAGAVEKTLREIQNQGVDMAKDSLTIKVDASEVKRALEKYTEMLERNTQTLALPPLRIKRLTTTAILPTRGSSQAIGLDLYADATGREGGVEVQPGRRVRVGTGIALGIPEGYYGFIGGRSGLAYNSGIIPLGGIVDQDYTGEILVMLHNLDPWKTFWIEPGMKIAQIIMERADILPIEEVSNLEKTARGSAGFGSTGV